MRQLLVFDTTSERGERTFVKAMATVEAQHQMNGYHFNPEAVLVLDASTDGDLLKLATHGINVPKDATSIGFTIVVLEFHFETKASSLCESEKHFYSTKKLPEFVPLFVSTMEFSGGVLFTILVATFLQVDGGYVPLEDDRSTVVMILD